MSILGALLGLRRGERAGADAPVSSSPPTARPRALHDGAGTGPRQRRWLPSSSGPKREHQGLEIARTRCRDVYRNNPLARSAIDRLVADRIGTGLAVRELVESAAQRARLQSRWRVWVEECDYDEQRDLYGLQELADLTVAVAGEAFVRMMPVPARSMRSGVPLQLQLLEPEHVPLSLNRELGGGRRIVSGVELDAAGRRVACWVLPHHPGDALHVGANDPIRVPAREMLHLCAVARPGQLRGTPPILPALVRMRIIDEGDDAQLERLRIANLFVGFVTKRAAEPGTPQIGPDGEPVAADQAVDLPAVELKPGTLQELEEGEDVTFPDPPSVGEGYGEFWRQQARLVCAAIGVPYFAVTGDYTGLNDRLVRVALNQYRRRCDQYVRLQFEPKLLRPVRRAWVSWAVAAGVLRGDVDSLAAARWVGDAWPHVHPVQDVQADALRVKHGFASRSGVALERGLDVEELDAEIARDHAREQELGLSFGGSSGSSSEDSADEPKAPGAAGDDA